MTKTKDEKGKNKQFRWSPFMSTTLLDLLAEEAMNGNKPSSTFKANSLARVANKISELFVVECTPDHIENHLRTIRKEWTIITTLKSKSGFGWDDNMKMIIADKDVYNEEVKAHPNHAKFLNKKIEMYNQYAIVVGKDMATGSFAKAFADIDLDAKTVVDSTPIDDDEIFTETDKTVGNSSTSHSQRKSTNKRKRGAAVRNGPLDDDNGESGIVQKLGEIAVAITKLTKSQFDHELLFEEVMKTQGFDDDVLDSVHDYLTAHELEGKAWLGKNAHYRKKWIERFVSKRDSGSI